MSNHLEFTGERFVPGVAGEIEFEHVHRYAFARAHVTGKRVLDAACGEGYGSALLAQVAASVAGVDIDGATLAHASARYVALRNLAFHLASVAALPFADASFDVIVSYETIEHLPPADQPRMLAEFARVLAPDGLLIMSAPNRVEYSDKRQYANPYHLHEHDRGELDALLATHFNARQFFHQRVWLGSALWREGGGGDFAALAGDTQQVMPAQVPDGMYFLVLAARDTADLPADTPGLSLFTDPRETELRRLEAQGGELIRLDAILAERTVALDERSAHVVHLEGVIAEHQRVIAEREETIRVREGEIARQLDAIGSLERQCEMIAAQAQATAARLNAELAQRQGVIDYRQSARWWVRLPWVRLQLAWRRIVR